MSTLNFKPIPKQLLGPGYPGLVDLAADEHQARYVPAFSKRVIKHLRDRFNLKRITWNSFIPDSLRLDPVIPLPVFVQLANFVRDFAVAFSTHHRVNTLKWMPKLREILSQSSMRIPDRRHYYWGLSKALNAGIAQPSWKTVLNIVTTQAEDRLMFRPYISSQSDGVCNVLTERAARFYRFTALVAVALQFMPGDLHQDFKSIARYRLVPLAKCHPKLTARYRPKIVYLMRYNYFRGRRA